MDDGSGPSNPKQAKQTRKKFVKLFRSEWLSLPEFKGWLVEHTTTEAMCKACGVTIKCAKQLQRKGCDVNENDPGTYVPLEQVYIGSECEEQLAVIEGDIAGKSEFRKRCLQFYVTVVQQLKSRLPYKDSLIKEMFLQADVGLSYEGHEQVPSLP
ncbi:hypothetical protein HPB49_003272 [Dermacentor silvarum]|uniref:Uncharacterized protein n=1 Tax=Dermacentor silvarum TaxID=543639 RepID=A0ACB8DUE8_DERSI|nr:hypothetical protein HPB49_003272 [Dermacentor silvarum]